MGATQFVILSREQGGRDGMSPIGPRKEILRQLSQCNTAPERENGVAGGESSSDVLYGPGIVIQLAPGQDPVTQMLLLITEEDIGWNVMMRLAKKWKWKVLDPTTGRELNP